MQTNINNFVRYAELLWGKHHKQKSKVFLLQRLSSGDNYNDGKGNQQLYMQLDIPKITQYLQENANTHDFSVSPAIYSNTIRSSFNICGLYCFWVEFDWGTIGHKKCDLPFASKDQCIRTIKKNYQLAGLTPSIIMNSGHGIHCYWVIDSNLIEQQTKKQVEQVNEWLFQIGIGINSHYYNEVKSITSLMRSPYPAVNRKIASFPVATKIIFTEQEYTLQEIRHHIVATIISKWLRRTVDTQFKRYKCVKRSAIQRIGDIDFVEADEDFMTWLIDSSDLSYYKSKRYEFDSTSAKETWIFKYLYLCNLEVEEIYEFCDQYMQRQYHIFRTRKNVPDRLKRIRREIDLASARNTFPKTVKYKHINMGDFHHE